MTRTDEMAEMEEWNANEDSVLRECLAEGDSTERIAWLTGRTESEVRVRAAMLGLVTERVLDLVKIVHDGSSYVPHHSLRGGWLFQIIGKRGAPINAYRPATLVDGVVVHLGSHTRF